MTKFKPSGSSKIRVRSNCFAWNNYSNENITKLQQFIQEKCTYGVYGKEIGEKCKTPHLQVYFELKQQMTQSAIQKYLEYNIHFDEREGTPLQASVYCKKQDENFWEFGQISKQGARTDLNSVRDELVAGTTTVDKIVLEDPMMYHQYGRTLEKIEQVCLRKKFRTQMTQGFWYVGPTGVGKSHIAFKDYSPETHYNWNLSEDYQDNYTGQKYVVINDFRGEIAYNTLLQMIDKWPFSVKRKGTGAFPFISEVVIITSSLTPEQVYHRRHDEDSLQQLLRRVQIVVLHENISEVVTGNTRAVTTDDEESDEFVRRT